MLRISILLLSVLGLVSCASEDKATTVEMDKKVAAQPVITDRAGMASTAHAAFKNAPGLTDAQKIKLDEVLTSTFIEAAKLRAEFGKTKGALFEALVSPTGTKKEVNVLKKRLVSLDQKRLDIMLKALEDTEKIIGKNPKTAEYFQRIFTEINSKGDM